MSIQLQCRCGQRYSAPDDLAGRRVTCRKCGESLLVPAPDQHASAPLDVTADQDPEQTSPATNRCPHCDAEMPLQAVLCTACGFNQLTGHFVDVTPLAHQTKTKTRGVQAFLGSQLEEGESPGGILPLLGILMAVLLLAVLAICAPAMMPATFGVAMFIVFVVLAIRMSREGNGRPGRYGRGGGGDGGDGGDGGCGGGDGGGGCGGGDGG